MKFIRAVAYHLCLNLPAAFVQRRSLYTRAGSIWDELQVFLDSKGEEVLCSLPRSRFVHSSDPLLLQSLLFCLLCLRGQFLLGFVSSVMRRARLAQPNSFYDDGPRPARDALLQRRPLQSGKCIPPHPLARSPFEETTYTLRLRPEIFPRLSKRVVDFSLNNHACFCCLCILLGYSTSNLTIIEESSSCD